MSISVLTNLYVFYIFYVSSSASRKFERVGMYNPKTHKLTMERANVDVLGNIKGFEIEFFFFFDSCISTSAPNVYLFQNKISEHSPANIWAKKRNS